MSAHNAQTNREYLNPPVGGHPFISVMLIVFFSFLFWLVAELRITALSESVFPLVILTLFAFSAMWYLSGRFNVSVLAGVYGGISAALFSLVPSGLPAHIIAVCAAAGWYAFMHAVAERRPRGAVLVSFVEVFVLYFAVLAWHAFSHISLFLALTMIALGTALIFFNSVTVMCELGMWLRVRLFMFSLGVGVMIAELFAVLSKLPFHIANIDFLLFFVYYIVWDVTVRYFSIRFTKRALAVNVLLLFLGFGTVLASVRWLPV
ncbi:hypothetical protein HY839_02645 [Candidatus Azambacteria bacterium]|nr:hypothetical protein [Candidatus Azambacteria bacterium]